MRARDAAPISFRPMRPTYFSGSAPCIPHILSRTNIHYTLKSCNFVPVKCVLAFQTRRQQTHDVLATSAFYFTAHLTQKRSNGRLPPFSKVLAILAITTYALRFI